MVVTQQSDLMKIDWRKISDMENYRLANRVILNRESDQKPDIHEIYQVLHSEDYLSQRYHSAGGPDKVR